jgi:hypothetical protein
LYPYFTLIKTFFHVVFFSSRKYSPSFSQSGKKKVTYYYDNDIGSFSYAPGHAMKPHRVKMTHFLNLAYDLYKDMEILVL